MTDPKNVLCKYYMNGLCSKDSLCSFSHDRSSKPSTVCTFYKSGKCSYGSACRYDHVKDDDFKAPLRTKSKIKFKVLVNSGQEMNFASLPSSSPTAAAATTISFSNNWVDAPEFVPGQLWMPSEPSSYSSIVQGGSSNEAADVSYGDVFCEYCCSFYDINDETHVKSCISSHEMAMNEAFKQQVSCSQVCGICLEVVWNKQPVSRQRFGVLSGCDHIFCLECIRKWRGNETVTGDVLRLCPQCRVRTDFIIPSHYWFDNKEDKENLISTYKASLRKKPCKYFASDGFCPFTKNCFYSHTTKDGQPAECLTRFMKGADGSSLLIKTNKLSDFFEYENFRRTNPA